MLNTKYLQTVQLQLSLFAAQDNFYSLMATAFGDRLDQQQLQSLRQQWLSGDFAIIPDIEILSQMVVKAMIPSMVDMVLIVSISNFLPSI